ncbi:MAG: RNA-binding protein [Chloroflexota bacterium]|nr:RNA-binding protein [Chloroflexota bacterium]
MKLYVGRLPYQTTDQDLSDLFGQYGQVLSATVIVDRETGRSKGFGFVEMNDQEAQAAMSQLNNSTLEGRTIIVNEAQDRREPRSGGGGGGGGGNFQRRDRRPGGGGSSDRRY